jgi:hypothetical protein
VNTITRDTSLHFDRSFGRCLLRALRLNMARDQGKRRSIFCFKQDLQVADLSPHSRKQSSKKSTSTRHSSTSHSKSSSTKSSTKSQPLSNSNTNSTNSSNRSHTYVPSEPLVYYLRDPTHSNPGYSSAYTTALTYAYGYPQDPSARSDLEDEIVVESQARVQGNINGYEGQMSGGYSHGQ